ncbi:hypothetical protein Tco_0501864 [Tanacetum coccineum]
MFSQATQVRRPRGRSRLSIRALTDITNIRVSSQPPQFCAPNILPTSHFLSSTTNVEPLTNNTNGSSQATQVRRPRAITIQFHHYDVVVDLHFKQTFRGLPPQNDRMSSLTNPTPPVMLSLVTIVDNYGNLRHFLQSACVTNPANSTRHVIGLNNSTPRHISESVNTNQNRTHVHTSVYRTQRQQRRMTQYADSGDTTYTCAHCQAKYWYGEITVRCSSTSNPRFSTYCSEGKVVLPFLCHPLPLLTKLMDYNGGERSKFSSGVADNNLRSLVQDLIKMLDIHNPLVQSFRMAKDRFLQSSIQPVTLRLIGTRQHTGRQYNLPTASEVAALIPGDGNLTYSRDVIVKERGNEQNRNPIK